MPAEVLEVVDSAVSRYPESGVTAYAFTLWDTRHNRFHLQSVLPDGTSVDADDLAFKEQQARQARLGKFDEALAAALATSGADERMPFLVMLDVPEPQQPVRLLPEGRWLGDGAATPEDIEQGVVEARELRRNAVATVEESVIPRLVSMGLDAVTYDTAGAFSTVATASDIAEIASWPEVASISLEGFGDHDLDVSVSTTRSNIVHGRGFTGTGQKVAVVENRGRIVNPWQNPYLVVTQDPSLSAQNCAFLYEHATQVAGVIRSSHTTWKGHSFAASVYATGDCVNGADSPKQQGTMNGINCGAKVINLSWSKNGDTSYGNRTKFYDGRPWWDYVSVMASPGNTASGGGDTPVNATLSPGNGYNVITVGGYNDSGTASCTDDLIGGGGWINPATTNGDNEKPEIVLPSVRIMTTLLNPTGTDGGGWFAERYGTSYAVPAAAGVAALLMHRSAYLTYYPTALKAIMLVSSYGDIDGGGLIGPRDGTGGLDADRADKVAAGTQGGWNGGDYFCSSPSVVNLVTFDGVAGKWYRVAISWMANPNHAEAAQRPSSDLNMVVYGPSGGTVAMATAKDRTWEFVRFQAAATGSYTIQSQMVRCASDPKQLSWALYVE